MGTTIFGIVFKLDMGTLYAPGIPSNIWQWINILEIAIGSSIFIQFCKKNCNLHYLRFF